jgi:rhodanese-related sulfurtransferase/DNA-binding transcriptional ArsR family regulator
MTASDPIYQQLARIAQGLASAPRLALLDLLRQAPRTVEDLAREAGLSAANASQHLKVLRQARLVEGEKRGVYVTYRVAGEAVDDFFVALRELGEARLAEVRQISDDFAVRRRDLEAVDRQDLIARIRAGETIVLDVRPAEEYEAAHIAGALSVPLGDIEERLGDLPSGKEVVAYCRGPYCVLAPEAVRLLRERGFRAVALGDGVAEWRARGLPVTAGAAP